MKRAVAATTSFLPMALDKISKEAIAQGHERLYPSLTNPNWLILRERRVLLKNWISRAAGNNLAVLDLGGRIQPYRPLVEDRTASYVAVDMVPSPLVDIVARGEQLPVRDGVFDIVICTQVLEYVLEPSLAVAEIHRVLKSGGFLLLTVPSIFPRDADHDCWRFMPEALRYLLREFSATEIVPEGSSVVGIFRTLALIAASYTKPSWLATLFRWTVVPLCNMAAVAVMSLVKTTNDQFAANFGAFAKK